MSERNPDSPPQWYERVWAQRYAPPESWSYTVQTTHPQWLCPDLLRYEQIGGADDLRGRVVRGFFWIMRAWPPARARG